MGNLKKDGIPRAFDQDGFLIDPDKWNRALAQQIAGEDGIGELTDEHWGVIQQLRNHYLEQGAIIPALHACRVINLDAGCVPDMFRSMREAWRIAGLPNPGEEAKNYM